MKAVVQRAKKASVTVEGKTVGSIDEGFLVLLGVTREDDFKKAELLAQKTADLRVFSDPDDKMNLSLLDIKGEVLVVSNFTLAADLRRGNRPSFDPAMPPKEANELYCRFCDALTERGVKKVEKGVFGADMSVELINDGPVTFILDTDVWSMPRKG